jgi:hypothetical protein
MFLRQTKNLWNLPFNMLTRQKKKTVDFNIKGYKSMDFDLFGPDLIVEASDGVQLSTIVVPYTKKLQYITPIIKLMSITSCLPIPTGYRSC